MSDTWDSAPLATTPAPSKAGSWDAAPLAGPSPQQRAVTSANDNGEDAAKALALSKKTNIPPSVIQTDLPGYDAHAKRQDAVQAIQSNPYIAKYIDSNPIAASVSSDDYTNLQKTSDAVQNLHPDNVRAQSFVSALMATKPADDDHGFIAETSRSANSALGKIGALSGRGSMGPLEGLMATASAVTAVPEYLTSGLTGAIRSYGGRAINALDLLIRAPAAAMYGEDKVPRPTFEQSAQLAEKMAMVAPVIGFAPQIRAAAKVPATITGIIHGAEDLAATARGAATRTEIDEFLRSKESQTAHAEAGSSALDKAVEVAQESTTKQRSPDLYEAAVEAHEPGNVHIDGAKAVELYDKAGKVPAEGDGLLGFVPDIQTKMTDAAASGGEVTIPISKYLANVETSTHEALKDSIRLHEDGVTGEEAKTAKEEAAALEAYHGTPHDFESFDLSKIGTGEGAQAYGHGLYFAENKDVAAGYRDRLSGKEFIGDFAKEALSNNNGDVKAASTELRAQADAHDKFGEKDVAQSRREAADLLESGWTGQGQLYKVSIHADPNHFLDWDKPLSEQQAVFDKIAAHDIMGDVKVGAKSKGSEFYSGLADHLTELSNAEKEGSLEDYAKGLDRQNKAASKMLAEAGIPGIKYFDEGSRNGGDGTRNYVVFDDKLVKIKEKNDKPIEAAIEAAVEVEKANMGLDTGPFLNMMFKDAKALGITEGEFAKYSDKIARAEQNVLDRAVAVHRAEVARVVTPEWKRNEAKVRDEVTAELREQGPFAAERFLRQNKIELGGDRIDQIADDLAPVFGFESGNAMRQALVNLEIEKAASNRNVETQLKDAIKAETAARMESRYGDLKENIAKEARQIALSNHVFDILADEVQILADAAGTQPPLTRSEMVAWAKSSFERSGLQDAANWDKLQRAVARGGREAEKALLKGDFLEAFQAKQRQMLAAVIAKESLGLQKIIDQVEKKIDNFSSERVIPSIDQTHLDQIRQMLDSVGIQNQFAPLTNVDSLVQFVADSEGQLAVAPWLSEGRPPAVKDMTVEQFRAFADSLKSMEHVGRQVKSFDSAQGKADVQNVIYDIKKELDRFNLVEQPLNPSVGQRVNAVGRWIVATHLLVERMLDYTDKFSPEGPLTRYLDRPLRDSNVKEIQLTEQVGKKLRALRQYTDSSVNDLIKNDLIPDNLSTTGRLNMDRGNLRQLMLHMGNWSNIKKVTEGFGVNEADLRRMIDREATEKDWKWVQGMWDVFADLKVEADAMQLRDTGVPADTIEPVPFETKFGQMKGGYTPIVYDKARSNIQGDVAAKNPVFDPTYVQATTPHGYTISRTQYSGPLDLTGTFMGSKIQAMVHDIAFRESVRQASRLINNDEFHAAMVQKWGKEYADLLPGWIKDIANVRNVDDSYATGATRVMAGLRQNITSALIAFNPGTYIKHGATAASMSIERVGAKALAGSAWDIGLRGAVAQARDLLRSPDARPSEAFVDALREVTDPGDKGQSARDFVLANSAVMRARQRRFEETIRGSYEAASEAGLLQSAKNARHTAMNLGRFPVALSDAMSAMPTWLAAYKEAMLTGAEHADAIFTADKEVSKAHGSSFVGDKPRVLRTGELMRWVTPLMGFWNHMANNYFQAAWDMGALGGKREEPNATVRALSNKLFWLVVIPLVIEETAGPAKDEHGDTLGVQALKAVGRHFGSSFVGLRDITSATLGGYEPSIGLTGTLMKTMSDVGKDLKKYGQKGQASKDWMIHLFTALGAATGVGGAQVGKTGSFLKDLATGKERPQTFNDWRQGLRTGHSKARVFK